VRALGNPLTFKVPENLIEQVPEYARDLAILAVNGDCPAKFGIGGDSG
jgi:hypothetical protein